MSVSSWGDLSQGYMLRNRSASLKQDIQRLTAELTSGQVSNVRGQLSGNYSFLTDVERKVAVLGDYGTATKEATHFTGAMQNALDNFSTLAQQLSSSFLNANIGASGPTITAVATEARGALDGMVSTLNGSFAGRALFAGNATDQTALVDSDALLSDLRAALVGATTPADMMALADAWFADPGGFATSAYQGGNEPLSNFALSAKDSISLDVRATDPEFTSALRSAAVASLAADPAFGLSKADQANLFSLAGQEMLGAQDGITGLQARVGFAEARIDTIASRNAAEITSLTIARNALLEADPYKTVTQLEEVQFQLQSLYSVTVRMSQLSLVNYL